MNQERDAIPWWKGMREGEPVMQRCLDCRAWRWPARAICNRCGSFEVEWKPISGRASIASWIVNHHPFSPAFEVPYTIAVCRLDEQADVLLPGVFRGDPSTLEVGFAVRAEISADLVPENRSPRSSFHPILTWVPAAQGSKP
jgi:uncharacterized OB-fold protein